MGSPKPTSWGLAIVIATLTLILASAWIIDEWRVDRFEGPDGGDGSRYAWKLGGVEVGPLDESARDRPWSGWSVSYVDTAEIITRNGERRQEELGLSSRRSAELTARDRDPYVVTATASGFVRVLLVFTLVWLSQGWLPLPGRRIGRMPLLAGNAALQLLLLAATGWFVCSGVLANSGSPPGTFNFGLSPLLVLLSCALSITLLAVSWFKRDGGRQV